MIVVDTSAMVAILWAETGNRRISAVLDTSDALCIAAPTVLELYLVTAGRYDASAGKKAVSALGDFGIEIAPFTKSLTLIAFEAFERFGKGRHKAGLNFGDCMAYALAKSLDVPLLYKGNDFALTDIRAAA